MKITCSNLKICSIFYKTEANHLRLKDSLFQEKTVNGRLNGQLYTTDTTKQRKNIFFPKFYILSSLSKQPSTDTSYNRQRTALMAQTIYRTEFTAQYDEISHLHTADTSLQRTKNIGPTRVRYAEVPLHNTALVSNLRPFSSYTNAINYKDLSHFYQCLTFSKKNNPDIPNPDATQNNSHVNMNEILTDLQSDVGLLAISQASILPRLVSA